MKQASGKLTVFFDPPFYVGVFERIENGKLTVSKVTFGAEPKDYEVYDFILHHYYELKFSQPISTYKMSRPNVQKILYKNVQLVCLF